MTDEQHDRILGRLSALELLVLISELKSLRGSTSEEIAQEAANRADLWRKIGASLEDQEVQPVDAARTKALEILGKLLVNFAGPLAEELENAGLMGNR